VLDTPAPVGTLPDTGPGRSIISVRFYPSQGAFRSTVESNFQGRNYLVPFELARDDPTCRVIPSEGTKELPQVVSHYSPVNFEATATRSLPVEGEGCPQGWRELTKPGSDKHWLNDTGRFWLGRACHSHSEDFRGLVGMNRHK
jgi:hypothetical protein